MRALFHILAELAEWTALLSPSRALGRDLRAAG